MLVSICYGMNLVHERVSLWESMKSVANGVNQSWILLVDFNAVRWEFEKKGEEISLAQRQWSLLTIALIVVCCWISLLQAMSSLGLIQLMGTGASKVSWTEPM